MSFYKLKSLAETALLLAGTFGFFSSGYAQTKSIDEIMLENAAKSQIVMFGENHETKGDNLYVISLLPKLKELGYNKIALEIDSFQQKRLDSYLKGDINDYELFTEIASYAWVMDDIITKGKELGMELYAIDERTKKMGLLPGEEPPAEFGTDRNQKMFENMKGFIFDKDPDAKVIVFISAIHINEKPVPHPYAEGIHQMLGQFLSEHVGENNNYTVNLDLKKTYYVDLNANENPALAKKLERYNFVDY